MAAEVLRTLKVRTERPSLSHAWETMSLGSSQSNARPRLTSGSQPDCRGESKAGQFL